MTRRNLYRFYKWKKGSEEMDFYDQICQNGNEFYTRFANFMSAGGAVNQDPKTKTQMKEQSEETKSKIQFFESVILNFYRENGLLDNVYNKTSCSDQNIRRIQKYTSSTSTANVAEYFMFGQMPPF